MIGRLVGEVVHTGEDHVLLDVRGVGYIVYCSTRTLGTLAAGSGPVALYTDLLVREDLLQLFGFPSMLDREWHRLLTTVQGVGAKVSLGILGTLGAEGISRAIALGDAASVRRAPGVGPKLATRIVNELKSKAPAMMTRTTSKAPAGSADEDADADAPVVMREPAADNTATADALSALANLGYQPMEAADAVARAASETPDADAGALIKAALRALAPKG